MKATVSEPSAQLWTEQHPYDVRTVIAEAARLAVPVRRSRSVADTA
ncbi:hypothetical protein [Actinomadura rifamycini]|nr:hypothetical protein [Actinomadura rifamycini]